MARSRRRSTEPVIDIRVHVPQIDLRATESVAALRPALRSLSSTGHEYRSVSSCHPSLRAGVRRTRTVPVGLCPTVRLRGPLARRGRKRSRHHATELSRVLTETDALRVEAALHALAAGESWDALPLRSDLALATLERWEAVEEAMDRWRARGLRDAQEVTHVLKRQPKTRGLPGELKDCLAAV